MPCLGPQTNRAESIILRASLSRWPDFCLKDIEFQQYSQYVSDEGLMKGRKAVFDRALCNFMFELDITGSTYTLARHRI
jgi:hypothetical protein